MEIIDILSIINSGGVIAVLLIVLNLMFKGNLISSAVVEAIVAETAKRVLENLDCPLRILPPERH